MYRSEINVILIALAIIFFVTVITLLIFQSPLAQTVLGFTQSAFLETPAAQRGPTPTAAVRPLFDTDTTTWITLRNAAIGFSVEYPAGWRKKETTLQVILSPSAAGLEPDKIGDSALWIGIPASDVTDPNELLQEIISDFRPTALRQEQLIIGDLSWNAVRINFDAPSLGGEGQALIASTTQNEVGYYIVAVASAEQWPLIEPTYQQILDTFYFTQQAVLRPTDATPPPTPTPTPTPVIYVVQSGDTLSGIALQYRVDMEALARRNDIDDPRGLRTGQRLIIPVPR